MEPRDLSELDRTTLRVWRATNLVGWGLAGLGSFVVTWVVLQGVVRILADASFGVARLAALPMSIIAMLAAPLVAGIVIGDHVYRWPGWTTIAASSIPASVIAWIRQPSLGPAELMTIIVSFVAIGLITARVSRARFEMRPRALRSS
jgi:hypothetical protein